MATKSRTEYPAASSKRTIAIVGGGVVGAATAFYLSKHEHVLPVVIERCEIAAAASGKAGGFLAASWGSGPTVPLHTESFALHMALARELGIESYRAIRTLQVDVNAAGENAVAWLDGRCASTIMDDATAQVTPKELSTKLMAASGARVVIATATGLRTNTDGIVDGVKVTIAAANGDASSTSDVIDCDDVVGNKATVDFLS
eukprot:m.68017 g.68017  ORF g.68017 m.68017 type:complete len:202 (-) comp15977_c0_seq3:38-643(-)